MRNETYDTRNVIIIIIFTYSHVWRWSKPEVLSE